MTITHTPGRLRARANGGFGGGPVNALFTAESDMCGDLIATLQTEPPNPNVEADARRLAACWNVCEGFSTEVLTSITFMGETMLSRFKAREGVEQTVIADRLKAIQERNEALVALESLCGRLEWLDHPHSGHTEQPWIKQARAVLNKYANPGQQQTNHRERCSK